MVTTKEITDILTKILNKDMFLQVVQYKGCFTDSYIKIAFACSHIDINNVRGQKPQIVSLSLNLTDLELQSQMYGGNGGQYIYRQPNKEIATEKYLAMKSVKVPFRKPKKEKKFVLNAITRFANNYIKTLKENESVLMYQDLIDYNTILN